MPMWVALSFGSMAFLATMMLMIVPPGRAGVQPSVVLFYLFLMASVINFGYLKYQGTSLQISGNALLWVAGAALTSFLGNFLYFKAINIAPNPGYACAIEASKAPVVALLSILLFASHFSILKGLGVLCCAVGVALISL
jgi:uncharacterized membrane protein